MTEKLLQYIYQLSEGDNKHLDQLQSLLTKESDVLTKNRNQLDAILSQLQLPGHTLGYLHVLAAICSTTGKFNTKNFVRCTIQLIALGSMYQIRLDAKKFGLVCRKMTEVLVESKEAIRAIRPLQTAIARLDAKDHLTPQHAQLALACISAKTYKTALPYLDSFVYQLDPATTGVRAEDTRLYFYYGAVCYIGLKKWDKAIEFFETVISAPAMVASAIMVEAYKKYVLVCLIAKGEVPSLPRSTAQSVLRTVKQLSGPYEELSTAYSTHSHEDLGKCADNHAAVFFRDSNLGLVGQVMNAMHNQNIKRLTKTYLTLTLESVATEVGLQNQAEAQRRILRLVEDGQLLASINQKESYVSFDEKDGEYASSQMVNFLSKQIKNTMVIHHKVNGLDRNIEHSDKYVQKLLSSERGGRGAFDEELMGVDPSIMYRS